jgi:hypothetical protein
MRVLQRSRDPTERATLWGHLENVLLWIVMMVVTFPRPLPDRSRRNSSPQ